MLRGYEGTIESGTGDAGRARRRTDGRRTLAGRIAAAIAFALAGAAASGGAAAQEKIRIGLAVPNYGPLGVVYLAEELGYYKEFGVQVEITAYRGGAVAQQALAAGEADLIDFSPPGVAIAVKKGVKERIVGNGSTLADGWRMIVLTDSPIKALKDIVGKKVGITAKGSTTDFFSLWAARRAGGEIQTVPVGAPGLIPALRGRQVDAVTMHSPLPLHLVLNGEGRSIVDFGKDVGPSLPDVWVASQAAIDQHPKGLEAALRATYKATLYLHRNRDFALKFLKTFTKEPDDRVVQLEYETAILGRSTAAAIRPEWLRAALQLADGTGIEMAGPDEIYTDRFAGIKAE